MLHNRFNPLLTKHEDTPPANGSGSGKEAAPSTETGGETPEKEKKDDDEDEPEPGETPAPTETAPEAAVAAAPKLNAFQRGALRALGTGDLVARVEKAEGDTFVANAEVGRLTVENKKLTAEVTRLQGVVAKHEKETPEKVKAASEVRDKTVSKKVTAELSALGISAEAAPSQIGADVADKTLTRAEFDKLDHSARNKFIAAKGKLTD